MPIVPMTVPPMHARCLSDMAQPSMTGAPSMPGMPGMPLPYWANTAMPPEVGRRVRPVPYTPEAWVAVGLQMRNAPILKYQELRNLPFEALLRKIHEGHVLPPEVRNTFNSQHKVRI